MLLLFLHRVLDAVIITPPPQPWWICNAAQPRAGYFFYEMDEYDCVCAPPSVIRHWLTQQKSPPTRHLHTSRDARTRSSPASCSSAYICLTWQRLDGDTPGRERAREKEIRRTDLIYFLLPLNWIRDLSQICIKASRLHKSGFVP